MRRYIVPLLIVLAFWAVPTLAQRGGTRIDVRALIPTCTAITGSCPSNNYVCVQSTTIYRCVSPNTWTGIGGGGGSAHGNGANCAAGEIPLGVDADGAVEGCYEPTEADISDLAHTTVDADHIDAITEIAAALKTGSDGTVVTGTATTGECLQWDANGDAIGSGAACGAGFTDIDTDYGAETVTSAWTFVPTGTGANDAFDLVVGSTGTYGGLELGNMQLYSSSFSASNLDLDKAVLFRQGGNIGVGNDPGIEFAWMEQGNTVRMAIPESNAGNATAMIRSVTVAGPYSAATGNNIVLCDTWTTDNTNIDCDTGGSGADLFVQDDVEVEGTIYGHEVVYADSISDIGGSTFEIDTSGDATFNTITVAASATPGTDYDDSGDAGTVDGSIDVNCPTATDCDMALAGEVGGVATEFLNFDSDSTDAGGAPDLEVGINHTGTINVGASSTTTVTIDTDGTGDGELTVPAGSISASEIESQPAIDCTNCTNIPAGSHTGTIAWGGTSILETGTAFQFGDGTDATVTHTYANTGTDVDIAYSTGAMTVTGSLTATDVSADEFIPVREAGGEESSLKMYEDPDQAGDNYIELIAPDSITSNRTCTLEDDATPLDNCVTIPTHTVCFTLFDSDGLATGDDIPSVWQAPAAITLTSIACEADAATTINVNQDSGCSTAALSTTNIESGDLACGTTMTAGSLAVTAIADGDCFDAEVVSVTTGIRANICVEYTFD